MKNLLIIAAIVVVIILLMRRNNKQTTTTIDPKKGVDVLVNGNVVHVMPTPAVTDIVGPNVGGIMGANTGTVTEF